MRSIRIKTPSTPKIPSSLRKSSAPTRMPTPTRPSSSGAKPPASSTPPGVNPPKAGNPTPSVGGKFGNIKVSSQSGIHVKGNQNRIEVSGSGHVFGNVTINNHNSPAAAPGDGAKGKTNWGAVLEKAVKAGQDIANSGLNVMEKTYKGAIDVARTAS